MDYPAFLNSNPALYAGILQLFRRNTVQILESTPDGILVKDTYGPAAMLTCSSLDEASNWLNRHKDSLTQIMIIGEGTLSDEASTHFPRFMEVFQAVYESSVPPPQPSSLNICPATPSDLPFISRHYASLDADELLQVLTSGELFMGYSAEGHAVGFIGQHTEGSIGMLQILPPFRRHGYAAQLECFMIARMLQNSLIPYCQFETDNSAS